MIKDIIDANRKGEIIKKFWSTCIGAGRAVEGLRADWQNQLRMTVEECGFRYIRFHGLLCDEMGLYRKKGETEFYNYAYIDKLFDALLEIGIRPFVEFGFMPEDMASGKDTQFWWKGNITPPIDYEAWGRMLSHLVSHWIDRYGVREVEQWYFEIWNEPNLHVFWSGTKAQYFKLYEVSVKAIKGVCESLRVGGPTTSNFVPDNRFDGERENFQAHKTHLVENLQTLEWKGVWIEEFLAFCEEKNLPLDFISAHPYPTDFAVDGQDDGNGVKGRSRHVDSTKEDGSLKIGNAVYDTVIVSQGCIWEPDEKIEKMKKQKILYHQRDFSWKLEKVGENQILLEDEENRIHFQIKEPIYGMKIRVLDPIKEICVMGDKLEVTYRDETGWYYAISEQIAEKAFQLGILIITIISSQKQRPFAFLKGNFLVKNRNLYMGKDKQQVITDGEFYITDCDIPVSCYDLLTAGYPFSDNPIMVKCMVAVGKNGEFKLGTVYGDGAKVWVDGVEYGYVWGPTWEITGISEGIHEINAEILPNTFNTYGPHHHIDGDRHLTSPAQYEGIKNFADCETSPEHTLVTQRHFRKFGIGRPVYI